MMDNRVCPVCGKNLKYMHRKEANKYCSRECYEYDRSPLIKMAKAENITPTQLIINRLNESGSVEKAAHLIGMSKPQLWRNMKKIGIYQKWVM